nr:uncharacterized protein LOC108996859 [Ipomoea trifida]
MMDKNQITNGSLVASRFLKLSPAPAEPPWTARSNPPEQERDLQFLNDRYYGLHGEIIAFTVIAIFFFFLLFLVVIPFLKRVLSKDAADTAAEQSEIQDSAAKCRCPPLISGERREL